MDLAFLLQRLKKIDFTEGLGIYLGLQEVGVAHVVKRFLTVSMPRSQRYPLPPRSRRVERRHALTDALATFVGEFRAPTHRAILCFPRQEAILSRLLLPATAMENLSQVVEYELERVLPLPRGKIYYDYLTRSVKGEEEKLEVLLFGLPRELLDEDLEVLELVNIRPQAVMLSSTALANYIFFTRGNPVGSLALLARNGEKLEITLLANGKLLSSHLLAVHESCIAFLWQELGRILPGTPVEDVEVYSVTVEGNGSDRAEDVHGMEQRGVHPIDLSVNGGDRSLAAMGAALEAVREGVFPLNFLPAEKRSGGEERLSLLTPFFAAVVLFLGMIWGISVVIKEAVILQRLSSEVAALQPRVEEIKGQEEETHELEDTLRILNAGQAVHVVSLLRALSDLLPADAYLTTFRYKGEKVELDGMARASSDLIPLLESSPYFKKVQPRAPTTKYLQDMERFSFQAEVEG